MLPESFGSSDPQRTCSTCASILSPRQKALIGSSANSTRRNSIQTDPFTRYLNLPIAMSLGGEIRKATYSLQNLIDGFGTSLAEDALVSRDLFSDCIGVLFITVVHLSFLGGLRGGTGLFVSRRKGPGEKAAEWSAPCAVYMGGLTFGAQFGAQVCDMVIPFHDQAALEHFSTRGGVHAMVGSELGIAIGPLGRAAEASVLTSTRSVNSTVSYSHSRGFYLGVTLDGAMVGVRDDINTKFYGYEVQPRDLLNGAISTPVAAEPLYLKLQEYERLIKFDSKHWSEHHEPRTSIYESFTSSTTSPGASPVPGKKAFEESWDLPAESEGQYRNVFQDIHGPGAARGAEEPAGGVYSKNEW